MLIEQQIAERRERAQSAIAKVLEQPDGGLYGDYRVESSSGKSYRVAMRGPGYCLAAGCARRRLHAGSARRH